MVTLHRSFRSPAVLAFVGLAALSAGSSCGSPGWAESSAGRVQPNFVLIVVDDLGWNDLAYRGNEFHETPHIDSLAGRGVRFDQFYAASPSCSPTRASIMTGRYPARLRLTRIISPVFTPPDRGTEPFKRVLAPLSRDRLPREETTIAERLSGHGYATALIGKWHLGPQDDDPRSHGFQVYLGSNYSKGVKYFAPYGASNLDDGPAGEYLTDRLTDEALRFIRDNRDRPFFLYLPHYAVHSPLQAKAELIRHYRDKARARGVDRNAIYAAMVHSLDESVGRIVAELERLGLDERTVVMFTSDNGGSTSNRRQALIADNGPLRGGKGGLFEGGIRVPTVISWPGSGVGTAGTPVQVPAVSTDLFPTIMEIAGIEPEDGRVIDGVSLVPLLRGEESLDREAIYFHVPTFGQSAIRVGDHKLIYSLAEGGGALYDLAADIGEQRDLAAERPGIAKRLESRLLGWLEDVGAQRGRLNPHYRAPGPQGWSTNPDAAARLEAGSLVLTPRGANPVAGSPLLDTQAPLVVQLRVRAASRTVVAVKRSRGRSPLEIPGDNQWHEYQVRLRGGPHQNRIWLFLRANGGPVEIDWLRAYRSAEDGGLEAYREWDFGALEDEPVDDISEPGPPAVGICSRPRAIAHHGAATGSRSARIRNRSGSRAVAIL